MIPIISSTVSGVAISHVNGEAKLALMKRSQDQFWCHVAGKVEPGETGWQTIVREFREETQIVVENLYSADYLEQFYEAASNRILTVPVFVVYCPPEQTIVLNSEHSEHRWCTLSEAKSLAEFPNQRILYDHIWNNFVNIQPSPLLRVKIK